MDSLPLIFFFRSPNRVRAGIWSDFSISQASWSLDPGWEKLARVVAFILFSHKEHGNQFFPISVIAWNPSFFKAAGGLIYWMVFGILLTYKHFKNTLHFFPSFPSTIFKMKPTRSASQEKKDGHAFLPCESTKPFFPKAWSTNLNSHWLVPSSWPTAPCHRKGPPFHADIYDSE